ncbi:MAG: ABC transporter permease [Rhodobacterales bacterium]|nr:ABC transporter permease [Rhodobacterales bacterium]
MPKTGAALAPGPPSRRGTQGARRFDKLGAVIALIAGCGVFALPFATFRANRIVLGEARSIVQALPAWAATLLLALIAGAALIALLRAPALLRLAAGGGVLVALAAMIGLAATHLMPANQGYARVSPASGFWLLIFAFALLVADCLARLRLSPVMRIAALGLAIMVVGLILASGIWDSLSVMKEYANRADTFWNLGAQHLALAFGSLGAAALVGIPVGIACHRVAMLRGPVLNSLNIVQTIPSIALFGILIAPMGWIAANVPGAAAIGISGIGAPPAFVALFGYSLLPVVANTVLGLDGVPAAADDAARGMGMTDRQRLARVQFPLAFPVILTGVRIVLVQNIGLATVAALIGGGGFGVFVFQGIGQTAMDLVLLGAIPTVALAFVAAILLDAVVEMSSIGRSTAEAAE